MFGFLTFKVSKCLKFCYVAVNLGFRKTDFSNRNESVLLETRLLTSFENCHSSLALQTIFGMPSMPFRIFGIFIFFKNAKVAKNIWHFYICLNAKIVPLFWNDIFISKCHAIIFWMA